MLMVMNGSTITEEAREELMRITNDQSKAYDLFVKIRIHYRCARVEFRHVKQYENEVLHSYRGAKKDEYYIKRSRRAI